MFTKDELDHMSTYEIGTHLRHALEKGLMYWHDRREVAACKQAEILQQLSKELELRFKNTVAPHNG